MKIFRFPLLLALSSSSLVVLAQPQFEGGEEGAMAPPSCIGMCKPTVDYCVEWSGQCVPMGECITTDDCSNPSNTLPVASCIGTLECSSSQQCTMNCDGDTDDDDTDDDEYYYDDDDDITVNDDDDDDDDDDGSRADPDDEVRACTANTDCLAATDYCAQGLCLPSGSCTTDTDCWNPQHQFDDKRCMGYVTCTEAGVCDRICGTPCPDPKTISCPVTGCDTKMLCEGAVACYPDRCSEDCAGLYFDVSGTVITECNTNDDDDGTNTINPDNDNDTDADLVRKACSTSDDCPRGQTTEDALYCGSDKTCLPMGSCSVSSDCDNMENNFATVMCIGTIDCLEGQCAQACNGEEGFTSETGGPDLVPPELGEENTCTSNEECSPDGKYCGMNGVCIPMGGCYVDPDCENSNNDYAVIACVGTVSCGYLKHCKKTCTGTDETEDGGAVSDPSWDDWGCTSNSDCLDDTEYCAQGTCMTNGQCNDDSDCWNPNHTGYADLRCSGYQYCNIDGYCTRNCGVQCNTDYYENEVASECTATGCDRRSSCEGAVSCFPDRCSDDCAGIYYDAAGSVITDCIPVRTDEGLPAAAAGSARDELTMGNNGEEVEEAAADTMETKSKESSGESVNVMSTNASSDAVGAMGRLVSITTLFIATLLLFL